MGFEWDGVVDSREFFLGQSSIDERCEFPRKLYLLIRLPMEVKKRGSETKIGGKTKVTTETWFLSGMALLIQESFFRAKFDR